MAHAICEVLSFASSQKRDEQRAPATDLSDVPAETTPKAVRAPSSTISASSLSPDDADTSSSFLGGSPRGDIVAPSGAASQARTSGAAATPAGRAIAAPAAISGAPATAGDAPFAMAAGGARASSTASAASAALGAAVAQSLGDGIRPMTMPPAADADLRRSGGHAAVTVTPDMGSGGGYNGPPMLTSYTFNIYQPDPEDPGKYEAGWPGTQEPIPIGAVVALSATSPGPTITSYAWSGGTYTGYFGAPASAAPTVSQAAPTAPVTTGSTYSFIVSQPDNEYTVTLNVQYQGGGQGTATLTFDSVQPSGALAVQAVGTQTFTTTATTVGVTLSPPIQISFTASTGPNSAGQFMILQIVTSANFMFVDELGATWHIRNNVNIPGVGNFNGPLHDDSPVYADTLGFPFNYGPPPPGQPVLQYVSLTAQPNTSIPSGGYANPYTSDSPSDFTVSINSKGVTETQSVSIYLMYQPNIQGSAWIALSQINWTWTETATNTGPPGEPSWIGTSTAQPAPTGPTQPSGAAAFPPWVNTSSNFRGLPWTSGP